MVGARSASLLAAAAMGAIFLFPAAATRAQDVPKYLIDEDCQAFDISADNSIVYAVPRMKRVKRLETGTGTFATWTFRPLTSTAFCTMWSCGMFETTCS